MKYSAAQLKDQRRPLATQEIPPKVWAQTWAERPLELVACGFRSLGETQLGEITGAAITRANKLVPGGDERSVLWADEYNAAVQLGTLGRALCQPDCADVAWFDYPDMQPALHLSPEGRAWLYARFCVAMVSKSILSTEEAPEELATAIVGLIQRAASLTPAKRAQTARHLRAALDILQGG